MKETVRVLGIASLALLLANGASAGNVLTLFKRGEIVFPVGQAHCGILDATFNDPSVRAKLISYGVDSLHKAFPYATLADTAYSAGIPLHLRLVDYTNFVSLYVPDSTQIACLCDSLNCRAAVVFAQPDGVAQDCGQFFPNDPSFLDQWGMHNTGQLGGTPDADIDAPEAWWQILGAASPPVGVIDSGPAWGAHPDFGGRVTGDIASNGIFSFHATHVTGIIAAGTHNNTGVAGVNGVAAVYYRAQPTALDPPQNASWDAQTAALFDDILAHGSRLINCSWALVDFEPPNIGHPRHSLVIDAKVADTYKRDGLLVAAMGNAGTSPTPAYPAASGQGVVAVGAIDRFGQRWLASASYGSQAGQHIDLVAPGVDILSTTPAANGSYQLDTGTSMATPHVTGAASLLLGANAYLHNDDIEQVLRLSADDIGAPGGWDPETGTGRLNAARSLEYLQTPWVIVTSAVTGGSAVDSSAIGPVTLLGISGLPEGDYNARRVEVRADIAWGSPLAITLCVWGRGVSTRGFSSAEPNFGTGWCEPVPLTTTAYGAQFRTYVYHVWSIPTNTDLGYFPSSPGNVYMTGAALGQFATAGCPQVEAYDGRGWQVLRTVLKRMPSELGSTDYVELPSAATTWAEVRVRVVENGSDTTTLRGVELLRIACAGDDEAIGAQSRIICGHRIAPASVWSSTSGELGKLLQGPDGYMMSPGETLYVDRGVPSGRGGALTVGEGDDPIFTDDGGKDGPGPSPGGAAIVSGLSAGEQQLLARTGIEIWEDTGGAWRLAGTRYPQDRRSSEALPNGIGPHIRLVSRGSHRLWQVGWFSETSPISVDTVSIALTVSSHREGTAPALPLGISPTETLYVQSRGLSSLPKPVGSSVVRLVLALNGSFLSTASGKSVADAPSLLAVNNPLVSARLQQPEADPPILLFVLRQPARVAIEQFDVQGRRLGMVGHLGLVAAGEHAFRLEALGAEPSSLRHSISFLRLTVGSSSVVIRAAGGGRQR